MFHVSPPEYKPELIVIGRVGFNVALPVFQILSETMVVKHLNYVSKIVIEVPVACTVLVLRVKRKLNKNILTFLKTLNLI